MPTFNEEKPDRTEEDLTRAPIAPRATPSLPPLTVSIFEDPTVCIRLNKQWLTHVLGAVDTLTHKDAWAGHPDEIYWAQQEVERWLASLADLACPDSECKSECFEFAPRSSLIEWFPNDPYKSPNLVPPDYLLPPWYVQGDGFSLYGLSEGDVGTDIARIPGIIPDFSNPPTGFPGFNLRLRGSGVAELHFVNMSLGGMALVVVNEDPLRAQFVDLNKDDVGLPPETSQIIVIEIELNDDIENLITVWMVPRINDAVPPLVFGGGLRKVVLCGFDEMREEMELRQRGCVLQFSNNGGQTWKDAFDYARCKGNYTPDDPRASEAASEPEITNTINYYDQRTFLDVRNFLDESRSRDPRRIQICKASAMLITALIIARLNSYTIPEGITEANEATAWYAGVGSAGVVGAAAALIPPLGATLSIFALGAMAVAAIVAGVSVNDAVAQLLTDEEYEFTEQDIEEAACCLYEAMIAFNASAATLDSVDWSCVTSERARAWFSSNVSSDLYPAFLAYMDDSDNINIECLCVSCFEKLAADTISVSLGEQVGSQLGGVATQLSVGNWRHGIEAAYAAPVPLPGNFRLELTSRTLGGTYGKTGTALSNFPVVSVVPRVDTGSSIVFDTAQTRNVSLSPITSPYGALAMPPVRSFVFAPWTYGASMSIVGFRVTFYNSVHQATGTLPASFVDSTTLFRSFRFCPALEG